MLAAGAAQAQPVAATGQPGLATAAAGTPSCGAGSLHEVLPGLQAAYRRAAEGGAAPAEAAAARGRAAARLGEAYLRLNRLDEAGPLLEEAAAAPLPAAGRAAVLLDLGRWHLARRQPARAEQAWARAAQAAGNDAELALAAELNRIRLLPAAQRAARLQQAAASIGTLPTPAQRARFALNSAAQARELEGATALAHRLAEFGRVEALRASDDRLAAEAHDMLAALYETAGRAEEALQLVEQGIAHARRREAHDLLMSLEARAGRLARALGHHDLALDAHRRAVQHIEAVRADIPVQYLDGRSSFRLTLEPTYLGLTGLLLERAAALAPGADQQLLLRQARDTVELIKQTELQDYLRDRCAVDSAVRERASPKPPPGTAIYTPVILPDRLELLLETDSGIERASAPIGAQALREEVLDYVAALRAGRPLLARSEALHGWLIKPLEKRLAEARIHTLVSVPDGVLRLLPLASLHDGRGYLIERLAVATVPGLSLLATRVEPGATGDGGEAGGAQRGRAALARGAQQVLLAGMSEPGPVVDKLSDRLAESVLGPSPEASRGAARTKALREALALPGVREEVTNIAGTMPSTVLLDQDFTLAALRSQLRSRTHSLVHIASHGVFGDSAETTFIMTYDELLTLDGLQALLREGQGAGDAGGAGDDRRAAGSRSGTAAAPIELLTLSACQTAEGDDRAPLGMSGTALKARARSALGTLWPVADEAANRVMSGFYRRLAGLPAPGGATPAAGSPVSRVEALRQAQLELLRTPRNEHPFYWAPFILIGDWQ
ncbi:MAG: CHAT domain-containing protein [Rubrivivax sp.]|nr:CHAT domain-containing protein [Rubrivivax sp.]